MNKVVCVILIILSIIGFSLFYFVNENQNANEEYLRIHVRANSNSTADQNVKYKVKDAIVQKLYTIVAQCETKESLTSSLCNNFEMLTKTANEVLKDNNFTYTANIKLCEEYFPTRTYSNLTLESGVYDAIIVELGDASGDNWWCVVYPPLCFLNVKYDGTNNVYYKSRIAETIKKYFG